MRGPECCFSYRDLFSAAEGRIWTPEEEIVFKNLTQVERNKWVSKLVTKAPQFQTKEKVGDDGVTYLAFWIE